MNNFKKLVLSSALVLSGAANAGAIMAPGWVSWDPKAAIPNFEGPVVFTQWWTVENDTTRTDYNSAVDGTAIAPTLANLGGTLVGQLIPELVGVGEFNLNLGNAGTPSCASCELTFSFGGIFLTGFEEVGTGTFAQVSPGEFEEIMIMLPVIDTDTAWINVYVDNDNPNEFDKDGVIDTASAIDIDAEIEDAVDGDE